MSNLTLTPEAKQLLSSTIGGLRTRLLRDIHDEAERRYRLSLPSNKAGLDEAHRKRRERLEGWLEEKVRASKAKTAGEKQDVRGRALAQAEKEAGATLINRLVLLRLLEAQKLSRPEVVTGGWNSKGYQELREFAPALAGDETEGYALLLQMVFDELSIDLPGLYGDVGLTRLFPIPAGTLREVVEKLDAPGLKSAWGDDTTLGWVYQYWNDPEREALDKKLDKKGKIERNQIASKTQMFTERYMVDWLLHNSLGLSWLCICKKNGWAADAERILPLLDARRAAWRQKREARVVALDDAMPIEGKLEEHWKYYVEQPVHEDVITKARASVQDLKLLDPACGSGHFLVIAFDLLVEMYREEARHKAEPITNRKIAESILERNLHGIDIDPRAIQIAAAGLYLKAKILSADARPTKINLVAPTLQLGSLTDDDPSIVQLRRELERDVGIPEELTKKLLVSLAGVDHLGTLLRVDAAVEDALSTLDLFSAFPKKQARLSLSEAKATVLDKIEQFLAHHSGADDLGLRLDGEQLAAGVRFVRLVKEGTYDVVVGNPPYLGTNKLADAAPYISIYPEARADIFAGFYLRALELLREGGHCALITLSNWLYLGTFAEFRARLRRYDLALVADLGKAAFTTGGTLISTASCVITKLPARIGNAVALQPHRPEEIVRDDGQPARTHAALLIQRGRHEFDRRRFSVIDGEPILYAWSVEFLARYASCPKLGEDIDVKQGMATADNTRFLRRPWEVCHKEVYRVRVGEGDSTWSTSQWVPYVKGGKDRVWFEPLDEILRWHPHMLEVRCSESAYVKNERFYFRPGVAFTSTGSECRARLHRYRSVFDVKGQSAYPPNPAETAALINSGEARRILSTLNPSVSFQVGDAKRLPMWVPRNALEVVTQLESIFDVHERGRETSVEFRSPTGSAWKNAVLWAQERIDRADDSPCDNYVSQIEPPRPVSFVSFSIGVALGRFGADGEGVLDIAPATSLPHGILFVSADGPNSLQHPACRQLHRAWEEHGAVVGGGDDLPTYLRKSFFDFHKKLYDSRPIYFPLSSAKKSYVAFVSIHRWKDDTLAELLVMLERERTRLNGELTDINEARSKADARGAAETRFAQVKKLLEELTVFIDRVSEIKTVGPLPTDEKTPKREVGARFVMDLDDGVMVNSSALWTLLEPQWKDPKKWWWQLANEKGPKGTHFDWSLLAARYFPARVRKKCVENPSLAVAHKCFWALHPAKAYAWELRLQDEIREDFTIDEPGSREARIRFLQDHEREAAQIYLDEMRRREQKLARTAQLDLALPAEGEASDGDTADAADEAEEADA